MIKVLTSVVGSGVSCTIADESKPCVVQIEFESDKGICPQCKKVCGQVSVKGVDASFNEDCVLVNVCLACGCAVDEG